MGRLENGQEDGVVQLRVHHLIGRAPSCHLRLHRSEVSGTHAALRWSERGWELGDLGSRNGTWVDGRLVAAGVWAPVTEGAALTFGHPDLRWVLCSDAAPPARAFPALGGLPQEAHSGVLTLPASDDPQLLIYRSPDGPWMTEDAQGAVPLPADRTVVVSGQIWVLELPEPDPRTPLLQQRSVADTALRFQVSSDEEHVALWVGLPGSDHALGAHAHHYLLLTLARLRLADRDRDPEDPASHGWVSIERLTRMLRLEERPLNLQIFRIRQQFAELGLCDAQNIVERRRGTGQLRVGVAAAQIAVIGA